MRIAPGELFEDIWRRQFLKPGQGFPADALAFQGSEECAAAGSAAVFTRAVAAEHEFILVTSEEGSGEGGIAGEGIIAGVGGEIAVEIREIGKPAVGEAAEFNRSWGVFAVGGNVGADAGPEKVGMADEASFLVGFEDLIEVSIPGVPSAFGGKRRGFLEVDQDGNFVVGGKIVDASHVLGVSGGMVLHFADADGAVLQRLRQISDGTGERRVGSHEPCKSTGVASDLLFGSILVLNLGQQDGLGHASTLDVIKGRDAVATGVKMDIDDWGGPRVLGEERGSRGGEKDSAIDHGRWRN